MPIDLLEGKKPPVKIKREKLTEDVELHAPEKERVLKAQKPLLPKKEKPKEVKLVLPLQENLPMVNLMKSFRIYLIRRRLTFTGLLVIITAVVLGSISVYFLFFYKPKPVLVVNTNKPVAITPLVTPTPVITPTPIETPKTFCGDGICQTNENYLLCLQDCPAPPPSPVAYCGDGICNSSELCSSCPADCGQCTPPPPLPNTEL